MALIIQPQVMESIETYDFLVLVNLGTVGVGRRTNPCRTESIESSSRAGAAASASTWRDASLPRGRAPSSTDRTGRSPSGRAAAAAKSGAAPRPAGHTA